MILLLPLVVNVTSPTKFGVRVGKSFKAFFISRAVEADADNSTSIFV
jgi:hypothetical protein